MTIDNILTVSSANTQGLRDNIKRLDVLNYFLTNNINILCLQDTHLLPNDREELEKQLDCEVILHGVNTAARGVAILLKNNFEYKIKNCNKNTDGNLLLIDLQINDISLRIINVYAPNKDSPLFFQKINELVEECNESYVVVCGDLNLNLNPSMDSYNYVNNKNPQSRRQLLDLMETHNLVDAFRYFYPDIKR